MNSIFKKFHNKKSILTKNQLMGVYQQIGEDSVIIVDNELYMDYEIAKELYKYANDKKPKMFSKIRVASPFILVTTSDSMNLDELCDIFNIDIKSNLITIISPCEFIIDCKPLVVKNDDEEVTPQRFYNHIINIGNPSDSCVQLDDMLLYEAISAKISNCLELDEDGIVQIALEDKVLAIAINMFIMDAKDTIGHIIGLQPNIFTEVSGPFSTVLLIDCEKIYLTNEFYGLSDSEWLI